MSDLPAPHFIPCGCCTYGCICSKHASAKLRIYARTCIYHATQVSHEAEIQDSTHPDHPTH